MPVRGWGRGVGFRRHRKATSRFATLIETLEERQLLTAAVLSEGDYDYYDFPSYGDSKRVTLESGEYLIDGAIGTEDNDWFVFHLKAGQRATIDLSPDEFFSQYISIPNAVGANVSALAMDGLHFPQYDEDFGSNAASASASDSLHDSTVDETVTSSASISVGAINTTPSLLGGGGSWEIDIQASASSPDFPEAGSLSGSAHVGAYLRFLTNHSGLLSLDGDPNDVIPVTPFGAENYLTGHGQLQEYGEYVVDVSLSANSPLFSQYGTGNTSFTASDTFSWNFTPDELLPSLLIIGSPDDDPEDGVSHDVTFDGTDHLTFVAPFDGTFKLVIANNRQFFEYDEDPGLRSPAGYYRPYHATVKLAGANQIGISAQYNDYAQQESPELSRFARTAESEVIINSERCGPYLPGVDLPNKFTVRLPGALEGVTEVAWELGNRSGKATKSSASIWTFEINMADFSAGTQDLVVKAKDDTGQVVQQQKTMIVHDPSVQFELAVSAGQTAGLVDYTDARFFFDVHADVALVGTISSIGTFYGPKVQVTYNESVSHSVATTINSEHALVFTDHFDPSGLGIGSYVSISIGGVRASTFGVSRKTLSVSNIPDYLGEASKSYNAITGEYEFHNATPALMNYQASIPKTGVKWIDRELKKLKSSFTLAPTLNVDAPISKSISPRFNGSTVHVEAKLLGESLFDKTFTSDELNFVGELNSDTLMMTALGIQLKQPLDFEQTFLDKSFSIDLFAKAGIHIPDAVGKATLELALEVMGQLTVDAGILVELKNQSLVFNSAGTFFKFTATPQALTSATLKAELFKKKLAEVTGTLDLTTKISISGSVNFGGAIAAPRIERTTLAANLRFEYRIRLKGAVAKPLFEFDFDSASPEEGGPSDDVLGPYELFTLTKG